MTEAQVQRDVVKLFERAGWIVVRTNAGTARGGRTKLAPKGWPDLLCVGPKRVVFVECKAPDGKLSDDQKACGYWLQKTGHEWYVVDSVETVEWILKGAVR